MTNTTTPASTTWCDHPSYDLSRHTLLSEIINDSDRFNPDTASASIVAQKFKSEEGAYVRLTIDVGPSSTSIHTSPEKARILAQAILAAADIVDAFEAEECMRQEAELARINAGPVNRIELPGGVVAFEPATEGGAA